MEADWLVEIGPDLPVIDVAWNGFVDLRSSPDKVDTIEEARRHSAIREVLLGLNAGGSPVFTTKCDYWTLDEAEIDPDEFAASRETARCGFASYIDVVDRDLGRFASFKFHECLGAQLSSDLHTVDLLQGRVDLVVSAAVRDSQSGFGITIYAAGCGASEADAYAAWEAVLGSAVAATIAAAAQSPRMGE